MKFPVEFKITDPRTILSLLWVFLTANYIYCDVFSLWNPEDLRQLLSGTIGGVAITPGFLLTFSVIMEIPLVMIVLSRVLPRNWGRWVNPAAALVMGTIQTWSLVGTGTPNSPHYLFFSMIEIGANLFIAVFAILVLRNRKES